MYIYSVEELQSMADEMCQTANELGLEVLGARTFRNKYYNKDHYNIIKLKFRMDGSLTLTALQRNDRWVYLHRGLTVAPDLRTALKRMKAKGELLIESL